MQKLNSIFKKYGKSNDGKNILFVLMGFLNEDYVSLSNKLYSNEPNIALEDLEKREREMLEEVVLSNKDDEGYYWCTYEEYLLNENILSMYFNVYCVKNNLYDKLFPYQDTIKNIEYVYENIYKSDDEEIDESIEVNTLSLVSKYYGKITYDEEIEKYYVAYEKTKNEFIEIINLYDLTQLKEIPLNTEETVSNSEYQIELTENEEEFLAFTERFLSHSLPKKINIIFTDSRSNLPHNYNERLAILNYITNNQYDITMSPKQLNTKTVTRLKEYEAFLKKHWGYDSFRKLKMYRDIERSGNETIEVSQSQIIDDIIEQSENALQGKDFRDVYVTSSTGAGKSIMFQLPALYLAEKYRKEKCLTIVISPLIGLMDDQVEGLVSKNISNAATIHSNISPVERRNIMERIINGEVDILYISIETLLGRGDITSLIGNRKIGLFVVDEAHIVTTWGKSFRADYWYMGAYLSKLRKEYKFPIVTFTATAIFGGKEDMYQETRDSLKMLNPIAYFGYVRRDDLFMVVNSTKDEPNMNVTEYRKTKFEIMSRRLNTFLKKKEKTLVYFPTVRLLNAYYSHINHFEAILEPEVTRYYGSMNKEEKNASYVSFLQGDRSIMLATKAFGMGIDIPDIRNVYHFAPTGNVIDYVQEIGRAARDLDKGFAYFDFLPKDFNEVKKLHGMSRVKKHEIVEVIKKIISIYYQKKSRNLVVSADDFSYIFDSKNGEDVNLDNKVKLTLLTIEKDFERKLRYSPFVARPRSIFGNDLVFVSKKGKKVLDKSRLKKYFTLRKKLDTDYYDGIYVVDLKKLWEKYYQQISFAQFKFFIYQQEDKLQDGDIFKEISPASAININYSNNKENDIIAEIDQTMDAFEKFLREKAMTGYYFNEYDLAKDLRKKLKISNEHIASSLANVLINSLLNYDKLKGNHGINVYDTRKKPYTAANGYINFFQEMKGVIFNLFKLESLSEKTNDHFTFFSYRTKNNISTQLKMLLLGIGETRGLLSYEIESGNNPQIFIRINNIYHLERVKSNPEKYKNNILNDVAIKHQIGVELLTYLFKLEKRGETTSEKVINYTNDFWDVIEDYFLGKLPEKVNSILNK